MTFDKIIEQEYKNFESDMLAKLSKFEIFHNAWKIAEFEQLKSYLAEYGACDLSGNVADLLQKYCEETYEEGKYKILDNIYGFELGYDEPQWVNFDEIHDMLVTFLTEWDTYDEDNNRR